jgi:trk system potassium uptake protein TrkH
MLKQRLGAFELLPLSFAGAIFAGALLLQTPLALRSQEELSFLDALFTSTSAVCVTGLTVRDTGTFFSPFGQCVILILMQMGGLGILTLGVFLLHQIGWSVSLRSRQALASGMPAGGRAAFTRLLRATVKLTLVAEGVGASMLFFRFLQKDMPPGRALWHAVFHAVSAFCNAGFSLNADSFVSYQGDLWVNGTLMGLIVIGGVGFFALTDIRDRLLPKARGGEGSPARGLAIQSRIVLWCTACLILVGWLALLLLEWNNTLAGKPLPTRILCALFQSVTARTAGFNTVDIDALTDPSLFILALLMFVGASPGGTGGGVKVTTFSTLMLVLYNRLRGRVQVEVYHRALSIHVIQKTVTLFISSVCFLFACLVLLLIFELRGTPDPESSRGEFLELLFEAVSAFGTVGLSTGMTSALSSASKAVVVMLMFVGRLGPLTLAAIMGRWTRDPGYRLPEEEIMIG